MKRYPAPDPALTLLYVEDEELTRETVCTLLGRRFPELVIRSASDGAQGLQLFQELGPDLVITDIKMPAMNGIEMARRILELRGTVPIVVTSAHSDMAYLIDSIEIGISRYVMKPIDSGKLFAAVEGCIAALRLEKELQAQQDFIRKLSRAVEQSPSSIVITDTLGVIEYVNPKFTGLTGYSEPELLGRNLRELQETGEELWATLAAGFEWHGEMELVKKSGEAYCVAASISPVFNEQGTITHFVAVKEDITERKRSARQIELLNRSLSARAQELEIANRDLESFSYTVSHDLRTPLTNINGYCQVILELFGAGMDEQCREFINIVLSETVNMNDLIKTLLDFSRLTRSEINHGRADLSEMASVIASGLTLRQPERSMRFEIAPGVTAYGDPELLRVVLDNLLGNACKYTGMKPEALIEFGVTGCGSESAYYVRDNGAGFDMAQADRLFSAFQRLHTDREFSGFGIGLATVQRIIQRHGGRVWAEAEVEKGATFYFTLPLQQEK
ncbi:MAG: hybrid sensor histidine kinase/response regulator [Geobacteraceae bacterium GWC2_58_44]|nr:MAG: hybrid sensor histidine kinase/response regulator [Geobacteraceae bacterium GWC2_58_44]HBG04434.1 hybrid sensor histidine kinase/response regulator [Geobacter sp.]